MDELNPYTPPSSDREPGRLRPRSWVGIGCRLVAGAIAGVVAGAVTGFVAALVIHRVLDPAGEDPHGFLVVGLMVFCVPGGIIFGVVLGAVCAVVWGESRRRATEKSGESGA